MIYFRVAVYLSQMLRTVHSIRRQEYFIHPTSVRLPKSCLWGGHNVATQLFLGSGLSNHVDSLPLVPFVLLWPNTQRLMSRLRNDKFPDINCCFCFLQDILKCWPRMCANIINKATSSVISQDLCFLMLLRTKLVLFWRKWQHVGSWHTVMTVVRKW